MNSVERVRAAFRHDRPDRVPIYEQGISSDVASQVLGRPAYTGSSSLWRDEADAWLRGEQAHDEFVAQMEDDVFAVYSALGMDVISMPWRRASRPTGKPDEHTYLYGDPESDYFEVMRYDPASDSCGIERHWSREPQPEDIPGQVKRQALTFAQRPKPTRETYRSLAALQERAGQDFDVFGGGMLVIPMQPHWLQAAVLYPEAVADYLDMAADANVQAFEVQAEIGVKVIWGGGDFACKHGPVYSPKVFHELMLPPLQKMTRACDRLGLKYVFRTDGNLWPVAQDFFVDSGIHGYGEIDIDAGMDLRDVHGRYPHLTLWGGVSCGKLLLLGSADEVRRETRDVLDRLGPAGGLLFGSSNVIMQHTPVENVYAYVEAVFEHGR